MSQPNDVIRQMNRAEFDVAVAWATQEGWNPGLHDSDVFWKTDPDGFLALERDGEMVGCGSIVSYSGSFGFMGFFIVKPELRGLGLGTSLWERRRDLLLSRLSAGAAIGMDGVFAMQPFYAKGGFQFSHRDLRMESVGQKLEYARDKVSKITIDQFSSICAADKRWFGFDRTTFLQGWLALPESLSLQYSVDGKLQGYGVIRKCQNGWKIGPLFSMNFDAADHLFRALSEVAEGEPIFLDIPEINEHALRLAAKYGMKEGFGCARMYHGPAPQLPMREIYGVTTFELG